MEKVVLACLGSFLKESGTKNVFVETEVFDQLSLTVFWMEGITYVQSEVKVLLYKVLLQKQLLVGIQIVVYLFSILIWFLLR